MDDQLAENRVDVASYIEQYLNNPGINKYCELQGITGRQFVERLTKASEGNFMYLRHVLPEIAKGTYHSSKLPTGLYSYYEDHWKRMKGLGGDAWFNYKLPVVAAFAVVREPVSIDLLAQFSGISNLARVREVLQEWSAFVEERRAVEKQLKYRIYHLSFHDFLASKPEIAELNKVENRIIDSTLERYGRKKRNKQRRSN